MSNVEVTMEEFEVASGNAQPVKSSTERKIEVQVEEIRKSKTRTKLEDLEEGKNFEKAEENESEKRTRSFTTKVVQGVAIACIVLNFVAIGISWFASTVLVAGLFAIAIAPAVAVLQMQLQNTDTMTQVINDLRGEVNRFQEENEKLEAEINVMDEELVKLKEQESRLNEITEKQGTNVDSFVKLVKENKILVQKQKLVVRQETAQLLSSVIINSDGDYSGSLDEKEAKKLAIKLNALPGVSVQHEALSSVLKENDGSMAYLLKVCNQFTDEEYGSTRVFEVENNESSEKDEKKSQE